MAYLYTVFGLTLKSAVPLPELAPAAGAVHDVDICNADLSGWPLGAAFELVAHEDSFTFHVPDVARYAIGSDGRSILVDPAPGTSARNVRLFLLGSAIGVVLHIRGLLPLHANAVVVDGRAHAFMGHRGAGKSTLAAAFHDRGFGLLSDDVCVVTPTGGVAMAQPGVPRVKLWRDALERSGRSEEGLERARDELEKFNVPIDPAMAAVPLGGIHLLSSDGDGPPRLQRLRGSEAAAALIANTYRGHYLDVIGGRERHLRACLALTAQVPVSRLDRTWDADTLYIDEIIDQLRGV